MVERKLFERLGKQGPIPKWQKAALHCWSNMDRRGHCPLGKGRLERIVGTDGRNTRRAVDEAIRNGWLDIGSNPRCLIAPYGMQYKAGTRKTAACEWH